MPRNARKRPKNHILKFVSTYLEPKKCSPFSAFFDVKRPFQKYLPQGEILAILGDPHPTWDGLGHFLEKNFPSSNGHLLDFGGV